MAISLENLAKDEKSYYQTLTLPESGEANKAYRILIVAPNAYGSDVLDDARKRMEKLGYTGSVVSHTYNKNIMTQEVLDGHVDAVVFFEPSSRQDIYDKWKKGLEYSVKRNGAVLPPIHTEEVIISHEFNQFLQEYAPLRE
jgi:hypothetical protein